ncbi:MAG: hypothetical protein IIA83_10985 [Thaumarchaeota archaeon]|nr:hypothetical protein [Nitrososphaerota archaeon]
MKIRDKAILNLGGKCNECGSTETLHLHHIKRLPLSVLWNEKNEYNKRAKEAFEHPERFNLLCEECHLKHHDEGKKLVRGRLVRVVPISRSELRDFDAWYIKKYPDCGWKIQPQYSTALFKTERRLSKLLH